MCQTINFAHSQQKFATIPFHSHLYSTQFNLDLIVYADLITCNE